MLPNHDHGNTFTRLWGLVVDGPTVCLSYSGRRILLSDVHPHILRCDFLDDTSGQNQTGPPRIEDTATGRDVFRLLERFAGFCTETNVWWDGQYLDVGHSSGEVLILDFRRACAW